jgi:uncharacterized protein (DUF302 family)
LQQALAEPTVGNRYPADVTALQQTLSNSKRSQLLLFGNPQAGTPLMVAAPTIALDLPLKALAWSATDGKTWLSYNDPNYLKQRFSLSDDLVKNIAVITPLIERALL